MKRIIALGSVAVGALALAGIASAQIVPPQFVVSGKDAEKIQDFTTINATTAEHIADACEAAAKARGVEVSVMVLDNDGNAVYADRMDGQGYLNVVTAEMKARTVFTGRQPSKARMNRVLQDPNAEFQEIQLGYFSNSGGLRIVVNKQLIGAVGVGGSAASLPEWSDEICAHKALTEVIGPSVPPLGPDLPRKPAPPPKVPAQKFQATAIPKSTLPAEWVVSGKDAANIFDGNEISLAAAKKIAKGCRDWSQSHGGGMAMYVLDNAGEIVHMERTDGETANSIRSALQKAQTALRIRQPTSLCEAQLKNDASGFVRSAVTFNIFATAGGIPIVVDGQMIGAVGVGGVGVFDGDGNCPIEGLKAAFGNRVALPVS
jgi:glc operon protein GlcG